jgi:hypothetical protein
MGYFEGNAHGASKSLFSENFVTVGFFSFVQGISLPERMKWNGVHTNTASLRDSAIRMLRQKMRA